MSILVYTGDLNTGDVVLFKQEVRFKTIDNQTLNKNKEIRMEKKEWHEYWENIDEQIKNL
jgi:hypothetical protein